MEAVLALLETEHEELEMDKSWPTAFHQLAKRS